MFNFPGQSMFRTRSKSPTELAKALHVSLQKLPEIGAFQAKNNLDVTKYIEQVKDVLITGGSEFSQSQMVEFVHEVRNFEIIPLLILQLERLDQESKKNVIRIFSNLLRFQEGTELPIVSYIIKKSEILFALFHSYENPITAITCGQMLRECLKLEPLAKILLTSKNFNCFFDYINESNFDIACDAFLSFRETLTRHKKLVAKHLLVEYDNFFNQLEKLILYGNYATRRLAIKLLADLLLDRTNFRVMTIFISKKNNLKIAMNLLKDKSRNIQLESFHVFKIFVANPKKAPQIEEILRKNKDKLIDYLDNFHNDKNNDARFLEEKEYVISQIEKL